MDGKNSSRRIESDKPKDTSRYWGVFNIFVKYCLPLSILMILMFIGIYATDRNFLESNLNNIILLLILPILISVFIFYRKSNDLINRSKHIRKEIYQKIKSGSIKIELENNSEWVEIYNPANPQSIERIESSPERCNQGDPGWFRSRGCHEEAAGLVHREQRELGYADDRVPAQASADCRDVRGEASLRQRVILAGGRRGVFCLPDFF